MYVISWISENGPEYEVPWTPIKKKWLEVCLEQHPASCWSLWRVEVYPILSDASGCAWRMLVRHVVKGIQSKRVIWFASSHRLEMFKIIFFIYFSFGFSFVTSFFSFCFSTFFCSHLFFIFFRFLFLQTYFFFISNIIFLISNFIFFSF